jgi:hypothetical protein
MLLVCAAKPALAWSHKEHIQLTRIAAQRLIADPDTPAAMKEWLVKGIAGGPTDLQGEKEFLLRKRIGIIPRGVDGLPYWAVMPDMIGLIDRAERAVEPFGVNEQRLHFIDVENFKPGLAGPKYAHDLSSKPKLQDFPKDLGDGRYKRSGMLPFAVEHAYRQMVRAIREKRLEDQPGQFPRDEHAMKWAGYLAHYAQDNTQPHHATEDHQSRSYFPMIADVRKRPTVHSDMEYRMVDDEFADYLELREEFCELFVAALEDVKDPADSQDPWSSTIQVALFSYEALPMIGQAAVAAYPNAGASGHGKWDAEKFFHFKGEFAGKKMTVLEMKARQQVLAIKRTEALWLGAWNEAHKQ